MPSILTIAGVDYDNVDRPNSRIKIDGLELDLDGGYSSLGWSEVGGTPVPTWHGGQTVTMSWVDDAEVEHLVFVGEVGDVSHTPTDLGWLISYRALSDRRRGDMVPITGYDLTGVMRFNLPPEDNAYTASESGLDVGQILELVLTVPETAANLDANGVGNYTSLSPPTLPAATMSDLALLTIVPPQQVVLQGEGIFNQLQQMMMHWMPKFVMECTVDGTIRFKDTTDTTTFVPRTIILPNAQEACDPVTWPNVQTSTSRCATRLVIRGAAEVEVALLTTSDGTLAPAWTEAQEDAWTLHDFTRPKDAYSEGTLTSVTGSSCTVDPSDPTVAWAANFWPGRQAYIHMVAPLATGIEVHQYRAVTSNTALTAGGTCTVTWDSSNPLDSTGYTKYRLIGQAGGNAEVSRLYNVREPVSGDVGLATYVGSHLVRRAPKPVRWANNSLLMDLSYSAATVCWSASGSPPYNEFPIGVEVSPSTGQFRLTQPAVMVFGPRDALEAGYPTTPEDGLPADLRILALYSRGTLLAVAPPNSGATPQFEGTAYDDDGIELTKVIDLPSWSERGDFSQIVLLAQQHLDALKDRVHEGSFDWHGLPDWEWWKFGTSINFEIPGVANFGWEAMNAPIRSIRIAWPSGGATFHHTTISFSNQRRPYSGDELYIPTAFSGQGVDVNPFDQSETKWGGMATSGVFGGGNMLGAMGVMGQSASQIGSQMNTAMGISPEPAAPAPAAPAATTNSLLGGGQGGGAWGSGGQFAGKAMHDENAAAPLPADTDIEQFKLDNAPR